MVATGVQKIGCAQNLLRVQKFGCKKINYVYRKLGVQKDCLYRKCQKGRICDASTPLESQNLCLQVRYIVICISGLMFLSGRYHSGLIILDRMYDVSAEMVQMELNVCVCVCRRYDGSAEMVEVKLPQLYKGMDEEEVSVTGSSRGSDSGSESGGSGDRNVSS